MITDLCLRGNFGSQSMSTTKISNFSIDHILGNEVGPSYTTEDLSSPNVGCFSRSGIFFQGPPNELNENWNFHAPRPLLTANMPQVPTLHSLSYSGSDLGYGSFHYHHPDFNLYPGAQYRGFIDERGETKISGLHCIMYMYRANCRLGSCG